MTATQCDHATDSRPRRSPAILVALALVVITVSAFLFRALNWHQVFVGHDVRFMESDCYYHMRRVFLALCGDLHVPEYDPYMNFPAGFHCNWPPLFDQLIAVLALIIGFGHPSPHLVETVGAVLPPIMGALTCIVIFLIARRFMTVGWALVSTFVFSVLPFHVQVSVLGRPDHHVAVVLAAAILFWCVLRLAEQKSAYTTALFSILAGVVLALAIELWVGSILFIGIILGWLGVLFLVNIKRKNELRRILLIGFGIFLSAALALWPVASRTYWATTGEMRWDALGGLHILLLLTSAAGLFLARSAVDTCAEMKTRGWNAFRDWRITAYLALSLLLALAVTWLVCFHLGPVLVGGQKWMLKEDRILNHVVETAPLSWQTARENFTTLVYVFPLLLVHILYRGWKDGRFSEALFFVVCSLVIGFCTLISERFSDLFSIVAAVLAGYFGHAFSRWVSSIAPAMAKESLSHEQMRVRHIAVGVPVLILCILILPSARWIKSYVRSAPVYSVGSLYELCQWMSAHTPPTRSYADLMSKPEYSVLATWDMGNAIVYIAHRPNVANNFLGWPENSEANMTPYRFFVSDSLSDAEAILDNYGARYVVVSEPVVSGQFARMLDILGMNWDEYFGLDEKGQFGLRSKTINTMALRLYLHDGRDMDHFRLIFESAKKTSVTGKPTGDYKVFEYDKNGFP